MSPWAAKKPCGYPGCFELTTAGRCERHRRQEKREVDKRRGSSSSRGYGWDWQKERKSYLHENPLCALCLAQDRREVATVVDHVRPHKGDRDLFWGQENWQALCKPCHDSKTAREDGRWQ